jgi:6-phosphogluconolactonase (cycloisomerase 2 family)
VANTEPAEIRVYRVGADGALDLAGAVPTDVETAAVRVHPSGRFAYATGEGGVVAYTINAGTGMLSSAGTFAQDDPPANLCFHPDGMFAYGNLAGGRIAIYRVDLDTGALGQPDITAVGANVVVLGLAVAPSGQVLQFLFAARADNFISSYRIDDDTGALTLINFASMAVSPSSMAVAPFRDFLYVAGEEGGISVHAIGPTGGLQAGNITPAGLYVGPIAINPSGRFAYAVTALVTGYRVSAYTIEAGALTEVGTSPAPDGAEIYDLAISPSGKHVYTTHTGFLTSYAIGSDGVLSEGATTAVSNPLGITLVNISQ